MPKVHRAARQSARTGRYQAQRWIGQPRPAATLLGAQRNDPAIQQVAPGQQRQRPQIQALPAAVEQGLECVQS